LRPSLLSPLLEAPFSGARLEVLDVAENHGHDRGGAFTPAWPRDVNLTNAAHAVLVEERPYGVPRPLPARKLGHFVQEAFVLDVLQKGHYLRMRTNCIRDVQEG